MENKINRPIKIKWTLFMLLTTTKIRIQDVFDKDEIFGQIPLTAWLN